MRVLNRVFKGRARGDQPTLPAKVKRILSKYGATLLMPGPAVPILGPELVVGGSFDSAAGWTLFGDSGAISGGVANLTRTSAYTIFERTIQVEANKTYLVAFESRRASGTGTPALRLRTASNTAGSVVAYCSNPSPTSQFATNSVSYTAGSSAILYVQAGIESAAAEVGIDNVSVREVLGYQNTYSSFIAGNYKESTGNTLAGVDQQVGLVVDAARTLGPELLPTLNFNSWLPINGATVVSDTSFNTTVGGGMRLSGLLTPGKMYAVTVTFTISSGTLSLFADSSKSELASGVTVRIVSDGTGFLYLRNSGAANTVVSGISVRELPGIHASQATSGFQPYLRQVPKTLGSELVVNGDFSNGTTGWVGGFATLSVSGGVLNVTATGTASVRAGTVLSTQAGRWYRVTLDIVSGVVTNAVARDGVFPGAMGTFLTTATVSGSRLTFVFLAISSVTSIYTDRVSGAAINDVYQIDNVSVCEVLEWTYAWQFDGTDDRLSLSAVPFQMADDHVVIVACRPNSHGPGLPVFSHFGTTARVGQLQFFNGYPQAVWVDDSGVDRRAVGDLVPIGTSVVITSVKRGSTTKALRQDGVQRQNNESSIGAASTTGAEIGARSGGVAFFNGQIHAVICINGNPSDAELLTLEKFAAKLQGRSL